MFRESFDVPGTFVWDGLCFDVSDVRYVRGPGGLQVGVVDVKLRWVTDGPGDELYPAVFVVDRRGLFIEHAVRFAGDPDHLLWARWAAVNDIFFYCDSVRELNDWIKRAHPTGWRVAAK